MDFKETLVLQPRMNSLSSANLWRLSWGTIKACSLVSINIPRYWSLVAGDEIHFSSLRKYPSPVNTLYTTYRAASAAFSLNFESRYSKLRDQKPCLLMISPISLPSIYKPQVIPIFSKEMSRGHTGGLVHKRGIFSVKRDCCSHEPPPFPFKAK